MAAYVMGSPTIAEPTAAVLAIRALPCGRSL